MGDETMETESQDPQELDLDISSLPKNLVISVEDQPGHIGPEDIKVCTEQANGLEPSGTETLYLTLVDGLQVYNRTGPLTQIGTDIVFRDHKSCVIINRYYFDKAVSSYMSPDSQYYQLSLKLLYCNTCGENYYHRGSHESTINHRMFRDCNNKLNDIFKGKNVGRMKRPKHFSLVQADSLNTLDFDQRKTATMFHTQEGQQIRIRIRYDHHKPIGVNSVYTYSYHPHLEISGIPAATQRKNFYHWKVRKIMKQGDIIDLIIRIDVTSNEPFATEIPLVISRTDNNDQLLPVVIYNGVGTGKIDLDLHNQVFRPKVDSVEQTGDKEKDHLPLPPSLSSDELKTCIDYINRLEGRSKHLAPTPKQKELIQLANRSPDINNFAEVFLTRIHLDMANEVATSTGVKCKVLRNQPLRVKLGTEWTDRHRLTNKTLIVVHNHLANDVLDYSLARKLHHDHYTLTLELLNENFVPAEEVNIFVPSRMDSHLINMETINLLQHSQNQHLRSLVFPTEKVDDHEHNITKDYPSKIPLSDHQTLKYRSICTILDTSSKGNKPSHCDNPIILTGAAGNGKSRVSRAVCINLALAGHKVLICAPTNTSCSDWFRDFLDDSEEIPELQGKIIKFSAPTAPITSLCKEYCLLNDEQTSHVVPDQETFDAAQIVICTYQNSIFLRPTTSTKHEEGNLEVNFSHIICEEAAYQTDEIILTPLASQFYNRKDPIKVILVGDSKQIYYKSKIRSLLRVENQNVFRRLENFYGPSNNHVVELIENRRNPSIIIDYMNKLSYKNLVGTNSLDGEIRIHHCSSTYSLMKGVSPYSDGEAMKTVEVVVDLVKTYGADTIVVIVNYISQKALIEKLLFEQDIKVRVQTAESLQGATAPNVVYSPCIRVKESSWHSYKPRTLVIVSRASSTFTLICDTVTAATLQPFAHLLRTAHRHGTLHIPDTVRDELAHIL